MPYALKCVNPKQANLDFCLLGFFFLPDSRESLVPPQIIGLINMANLGMGTS